MTKIGGDSNFTSISNVEVKIELEVWQLACVWSYWRWLQFGLDQFFVAA